LDIVGDFKRRKLGLLLGGIMGEKQEGLKILFVCTANRMRSKTAEKLYENDKRFTVKSAGVADFAEVPLTLELLNWADYVIVMEDMHIQWIRESFPRFFFRRQERVLNLEIPDIYNFMDFELVYQVEHKFETWYREEINPGWTL
jgi:protein-tyrosine phosphatase